MKKRLNNNATTKLDKQKYANQNRNSSGEEENDGKIKNPPGGGAGRPQTRKLTKLKAEQNQTGQKQHKTVDEDDDSSEDTWSPNKKNQQSTSKKSLASIKKRALKIKEEQKNKLSAYANSLPKNHANTKQMNEKPIKKLNSTKVTTKKMITDDNDNDDDDMDDNHNHVTPVENSADSSSSSSSDEDNSIKTNAIKYQNARKVLNSYETNELPGRENEFKQLTTFLENSLINQKSASLYISGQPGTGKTACLQKLLNHTELANEFEQCYLNCTSITSIGGIYKKIVLELQLNKSNKTLTEKYALETIETYLKKLSSQNNKKKMILMVLDEIDQLIGQKQKILYTLFEWPSKFQSCLLLIGIANSLDLIDRLSRLNVNTLLKPQLMHFKPYTKQQIINIFTERLTEAGVLDLFSAGTLQLLAAKVSAISGDVRKALDIGRRVIEKAEEHFRRETTVVKKNHQPFDVNAIIDKLEQVDDDASSNGTAATTITNKSKQMLAAPIEDKIKIHQVIDVLNNVYCSASSNLKTNLDNDFLPLQQKILICSILLIENNEKNKDITIGRLHRIYSRICNNRHIAPVDQSEFSNLCELIETKGILRIIKKSDVRLNRIQLQWDTADITNILRDEQMLSSILADKSCLAAK